MDATCATSAVTDTGARIADLMATVEERSTCGNRLDTEAMNLGTKVVDLATTIEVLTGGGIRPNTESVNLDARRKPGAPITAGRVPALAPKGDMHGKLRGRHLGDIRCRGVRIFKFEWLNQVEIMA